MFPRVPISRISTVVKGPVAGAAAIFLPDDGALVGEVPRLQHVDVLVEHRHRRPRNSTQSSAAGTVNALIFSSGIQG